MALDQAGTTRESMRVETRKIRAYLGREERFRRNLKDVNEILELNGIKFWLDYGTLLGAVRGGRMIEWDYDIDFGTLDECWKDLVGLIPQFQELGFFGYTTNVRLPNDLISRGLWLRRYGLRVDIMIYQRVKRDMLGIFPTGFIWTKKTSHHLLGTKFLSRIIRSGYLFLFNEELFGTHYPSRLDLRKNALFKVCGSLVARISVPLKNGKAFVWKLLMIAGFRFGVSTVPNHFFEKLATIEMYGFICNTPSDVEKYLELHYGDWRTPKKDFDWTTDDRTVVRHV